jgi:hypothetical protein
METDIYITLYGSNLGTTQYTCLIEQVHKRKIHNDSGSMSVSIKQDITNSTYLARQLACVILSTVESIRNVKGVRRRVFGEGHLELHM